MRLRNIDSGASFVGAHASGGGTKVAYYTVCL
jgi:hypothetical protein